MTKALLLDVDALMDTRLGQLHCLHPEAATAVVGSEKYWYREQDNWTELTNGRVTTEAFQTAWEERGKEVLKASHITGIMTFVLKVLGMFLHNVVEGYVRDEVKLVVNHHPYDLDADEQAVMTECIRALTYEDLEVEYVSLSLQDLTPMYLRDRYAGMILYELHRWIKLHYLNFPQAPCQGMDVIGPRLWEKDPSGLTLEDKKHDIMWFQFVMTEYMALDFLDPEWFSVGRPNQQPPSDT